MRPPKVTVLYHYFYPDDVVSARHFADFCKGLVARGWQVEAMPCNRGCRDEQQTYPSRETWCGITIRRVWRPRLRQASTVGRLVNAAWMILAWSLLLVFRRRKDLPDVLVVGTDPILSVLAAWFIKRLRPSVQVAHWCYDLYPEAPIAEGMLREESLVVRLLKRLTRAAYHSCAVLADLGDCMRRLLERYQSPARPVTLVPWALSEPATVVPVDQAVRRELFGEATLGLLYSGNFGRAHSYAEFLELARCLRGEPIHFCFAVRGNQTAELHAAVQPEDKNVSFAGFAPESALEKRLGAADIHLVSLRPAWTGVVVPSKFFGSLAAGRPVLFAGSQDAAIARWIREQGVGWVLDRGTLSQVAQELRRLARDARELQIMRQRCHEVYQAHFSMEKTMDQWDRELRALLRPDRRSQENHSSTPLGQEFLRASNLTSANANSERIAAVIADWFTARSLR
jgi:colanic acid biosynthesis glycosyl transferase WcaI